MFLNENVKAKGIFFPFSTIKSVVKSLTEHWLILMMPSSLIPVLDCVNIVVYIDR